MALPTFQTCHRTCDGQGTCECLDIKRCKLQGHPLFEAEVAAMIRRMQARELSGRAWQPPPRPRLPE